MSYSNMTSYTQTLPPQQTYPQQVVYMPTAGSPGHHQQHQPRPMYFITRSNGSIVPLIPADELPYNVRLEGAPRNMSPEQTAGMQFLGSLPYTGMVFKTKDDAPTMQRTSSQPATSAHHRQYSNGKQYMAPDALARQASNNAAHHSYSLSNTYTTPMSLANRTGNTPSPPTEAHSAPHTPLTDPQAIIDAIVSSKSGAETAARVGYLPKTGPPITTPSGRIPDANKKTHCSYWIRTGECDYAQQGCMYKHEMPDEKGLLELGFRSTPRWWLEKNRAIKLGSGVGGKRPTVGPVVKASEWLRKESVASTVSVKSSVSSDDGTETAKSKSSVESEGQCSQAGAKHRTPATEKTSDKKVTILKKPASKTDNNVLSESKAVITSQTSAKAKASTEPVTDDLIDFALSGSSAPSIQPAVTPPTSTESSPRALPSTPSSSSDGGRRSQRREIFVPKGESKTQHLAEHAFRQQRAVSRRPKPSEAQVASLERQIQLAQKSKHLAGAAGSGGAGLMASRHAPAAGGKGGDGRKGGRTATGLRVRRPALHCVEIPTGRKLREKAERMENIFGEGMVPVVKET